MLWKHNNHSNMAAPMSVSMFIPHAILNKCSYDCYVLGYWHIFQENVLINCTTTVEKKSKDLDESLFSFLNFSNVVDQDINFLGLLYSSETEKCLKNDLLKCPLNDVAFVIRINEVSRSFYVEHISLLQHPNISEVQVVIYDGCGITNSQLLPLNKNFYSSNKNEKSFTAFLVSTCQNLANNSEAIFCNKQLNNLKVTNFTGCHVTKTIPTSVSPVWFSLLWIISFLNTFTFVFKWCPQWIKNLLLSTAVGQQFHQRFIHGASLYTDFNSEIRLSVKCKNLICAILIDVIFGYIVTYTLLNTSIPDLMLNTAIVKTNEIVAGLQNLINWLMGAPAGLKLNIPLNNALGKFFLYHIYLWESYMMVVQPLFAFIFKISTVIGVFGFTFFLSLLSDLMSLATIHIYCFYGYAARLYGYQILSLSALWRLFRGKKWNPLRQRIDSYTYNVHQLYLGTLIFTVLLFLLPTVMVYYFVFTCLRLLVLVLQGLISRFINILTISPLYCIILRLLNSSEVAGDVYFTVLNSEGVLTLSMQVSQIPFKSVIQLTLPELKKYSEDLAWKEFLSSIFFGKIVYPL